MKPTDQTELLNWNAMKIRTEKEDKIIKERMEEAWEKKVSKEFMNYGILACGVGS